MNSIVQFNYSHDNDGWGFLVSGHEINPTPPREPVLSLNNIVRFNISYNDCRNSHWGAMLFDNWSPTDIHVYNNTFYMSDNGLDAKYVAPALGFRPEKNVPIGAAPPTIQFFNNIFFTQVDRGFRTPFTVPVIEVDQYPRDNFTFDVTNVTFLGNDYFCRYGRLVRESSSAGGFSDPQGATDDPILRTPPTTYTVGDIDNMGNEMRGLGYFVLTPGAPSSVRTQGVDVASILGQRSPTDFFGNALPAAGFSMGANQYAGP